MTTDNRTKFREALEAYRVSTDETRAAAMDAVDNAVIDLELDAADEVRNGEDSSTGTDHEALFAAITALEGLDHTMRDRALRAARAILLPTPPSFGERYADELRAALPTLLSAIMGASRPSGVPVDGPHLEPYRRSPITPPYGGLSPYHRASDQMPPIQGETVAAEFDVLKAAEQTGAVYRDAEGVYWYRPDGAKTTVRVPDGMVAYLQGLVDIVGP